MERKTAYCALYFSELLYSVIDVTSRYCWKNVDQSEITQ